MRWRFIVLASIIAGVLTIIFNMYQYSSFFSSSGDSFWEIIMGIGLVPSFFSGFFIVFIAMYITKLIIEVSKEKLKS